jgi:hypothetical protein
LLVSSDVHAQRSPGVAVRVGEHDIGGVVTGPDGPEAGVWVIVDGYAQSGSLAAEVVARRRNCVLPRDSGFDVE